ncbi:hypothetical protein [Planctomycetes bacterium Pla163]|uniref:hypothetical protein n=1 Tax=Rohdeia mirabilis TaxID=2528008 RepID=UPI0011A698A7
MTSGNGLRESVVSHLRLARSASELRAYRRAVPVASVVAEVFCGWEDLFHPGTPLHGETFTTAEQEALARFDRVVDSVAEETADDTGLEDWLNSSPWRVLSSEATVALVALGVALEDADLHADAVDDRVRSLRSLPRPPLID